MTVDFGLDTSCTDALRAGTLVSGPRLAAEAIYRRLTTRKGELPGSPGYGFHVRDLVGSTLTDADVARLPGLIRQEILKDARLDSADVDVSLSGSNHDQTITITVEGYTGRGPFALVLGVSSVTVELLRIS